MRTRSRSLFAALAAGGVALAAPVHAQGNARVLEAIRREGMENSRLEPLAQALFDSIGPRLVGTAGQAAAHEWAVARFREWGVQARNDPYGTWPAWSRGTLHVDLTEPRARTLEARLLSWSPGTNGPVKGEVIAIPLLADRDALSAWLPSVRGKWVLVSPAPPSCRPLENWQRWAAPDALSRLARETAEVDSVSARRERALGISEGELAVGLGMAGAAGTLTTNWTGGWGTQRVHDAFGARAPVIDVTCEDYGLLSRLAANGQGPVLRVESTATAPGAPVPAMNTVATLPGRSLPNEYVLLSAHFDSWDAGSGATDNGTGTLVMMEAMRILRAVDPNPRRTIVVGLWGSEEQGLNGSRAFAEDHPEIVANLQVVLNQDTGTGRIDRASLQGFPELEPFFRRWLGLVPAELGGGIEVDAPGLPSAGSSDHSSFACRGVPALWLLSTSWDYGTYTWHTDRDTYDKVVFADVRRNAVLLAMLAYLASEDARVPATKRTDLPAGPGGAPGRWPACGTAQRSVG